MYVIKRTDSNKYWQEWSWMDNPWDAQQYSENDAEAGVLFFTDLNIPCEIECLS